MSENKFSPLHFLNPTIFDCNNPSSVSSRLRRSFDSRLWIFFGIAGSVVQPVAVWRVRERDTTTTPAKTVMAATTFGRVRLSKPT